MVVPVQNPNWPVLDYSVALTGSPGTPSPFFWMSIKERAEGAVDTQRGKQYALDKMQAGTMDIVIRNDDGAFTPGNSASPYSPQITDFRMMRCRAQYPPSINILHPEQADAIAATGSLPANTASITGNFTAQANNYAGLIPAATPNGVTLVEWWDFSIAPINPDGTATTYTASMTVAVNVTVILRASIQWRNAAGAVISTSNGAGVTVTGGGGAFQLTVTAQPPAGCAGAVLFCAVNTTTGAASNCNISFVQLERNATASAWTLPGTWYDLWRGFIDTWPQDWNPDGTYGLASLSAADVYSILASRNIKSPGYAEILNLNPTFFYPLDEPGPGGFNDATNNLPATSFVSSGTAVGYTDQYGAPILGGNHAGISGPVAQINQPGTGSNSIYLQIGSAGNPLAFLPLAGTVGFTRLWALNPSVDPTGAANPQLWNYIDQQVGNLGAVTPDFQVFIGTQPLNAGGQPFIDITIANVLILSTTLNGPAVVDGNMHVIALTCDSTGKNLVVYVDGIANAFTLSADMRFRGPQMSDVLCPPDTVNSAQYSCIAQWTGTVLTASQISNITNTILGGGGLDGSLNSNGLHFRTSSTRYADILRWLNWTGPTNIDAWGSGQTVNYGAPSEFLGTIGATGTDGLSALETVVTTENGDHFAAGNGALTMQARRHRYNAASKATFGEDTGEIPYTSATFLYDTTRVVTDAQMTQTNTSAVVTTLSANFSDPNGPGDVPLQRDINTTLAAELSDAGQFITQALSVPQNRIETITVPLSSYTVGGAASAGAWATVLPLEIGDLVTVMRRPPNAAAYTFLGFIEQIQFHVDDQLDAYATLQISPANLTQFWQMGAVHLVQAGTVAAGTTSINLPPLPDAAINPAQANISVDPNNATWAVDWGTSIAEYATITGVTHTSVGYSVFTMNIGNCIDAATGAQGTGLRHTHTSGAIWQDIGGWLNEPGHNPTKLSAAIVPVTALDALSTLNVSTILGY